MTNSGRRCAVIGDPADHSLSPALHLAAYRALGLDWGYQAITVAPGALDEFVRTLDESWRGLSVTMPHKQAIRAWGEGDELVELTGVANTWLRTEHGAIVRNTDVGGYQLAFAQHDIETADSAIVVGNGATARSACVALRQMGVERLLLLARSPERAQQLRRFCSEALGMLCQVRELAPGNPIDSDIVLSTVPAGGANHLADELVAHAGVVFDSVYDPWPTTLSTAAAVAGRPTLNGLDLLAGQAVEQVRLMTGGEVGFELLRSAGQEELNRRSQV